MPADGITTLRGKNVRERIRELISVAHADFQSELKAEAKRLYGVTVQATRLRRRGR